MNDEDEVVAELFSANPAGGGSERQSPKANSSSGSGKGKRKSKRKSKSGNDEAPQADEEPEAPQPPDITKKVRETTKNDRGKVMRGLNRDLQSSDTNVRRRAMTDIISMLYYFPTPELVSYAMSGNSKAFMHRTINKRGMSAVLRAINVATMNGNAELAQAFKDLLARYEQSGSPIMGQAIRSYNDDPNMPLRYKTVLQDVMGRDLYYSALNSLPSDEAEKGKKELIDEHATDMNVMAGRAAADVMNRRINDVSSSSNAEQSTVPAEGESEVSESFADDEDNGGPQEPPPTKVSDTPINIDTIAQSPVDVLSAAITKALQANAHLPITTGTDNAVALYVPPNDLLKIKPPEAYNDEVAFRKEVADVIKTAYHDVIEQVQKRNMYKASKPLNVPRPTFTVYGIADRHGHLRPAGSDGLRVNPLLLRHAN